MADDFEMDDDDSEEDLEILAMVDRMVEEHEKKKAAVRKTLNYRFEIEHSSITFFCFFFCSPRRRNSSL